MNKKEIKQNANQIFDSIETFNSKDNENNEENSDYSIKSSDSIKRANEDFYAVFNENSHNLIKNIENTPSISKLSNNDDFDGVDDVQKEIPIKASKELVIPKKSPEEKVVKEALTESINLNDIEDKDMASDWNLTTDIEVFKLFYSYKRDIISKMTRMEGEIDFKRFNDDLLKAKVDTRIETRDMAEINYRMQQVQSWRDRVCEIGVRVNNQYFPWKRFIELMRGLLAKVEYDKPAVKHDGLIFFHLRDMEMYFSKLEALHNSVYIVMKNLDSSYDSLSRHLTLALSEMEASKNVIVKDKNFGIIDKEIKSNSNIRVEEARAKSVDW